jgi:hypothetical protein
MLRNGDKATQFGPPAAGRGAASRPARGRVCEDPDCGTILSTYNSADLCWMHERAPFPARINRVKD